MGQNNVGKSTILEAIRWVLKPTALLESDFHSGQSTVTVAACVEGITSTVLDKIREQKHRKAIEPYCHDGTLWIRASNGRGTKAITKEIWDPEQYSGFDLPDHWRSYPTGLPQAVNALLPEPLFIEAMEDIGEDLGKSKAGTTIKRLLDEIMGPVLDAHADLNNALDRIRSILAVDGTNRSSLLQRFDEEATRALSDFFPGLDLDLDLQAVSIKEFFKTGDLRVTDNMTGDQRRFDQMGTGAQRAIQMALVRYLAETRAPDENDPSRRLLLIDEPELYLHPQGVRHLRQALFQLSNAGFQVVFSTHSPLMLSRENAGDTVIVSKTVDDGVHTQKPLRRATKEALEEAESQTRTLFELGNLAEIYFADRVVLCEGKTDRRLLPLAYERLYGRTPDLDHIAFVALGSCSDIPKALPVLSAMGISACAVADLDFAFTAARAGKHPLLPKKEEDLDRVRDALRRMKDQHGFTLGGDGLPINDKSSGWRAVDAWAKVVEDREGRRAVDQTHDALKDKGVWVWPIGSIEEVTGHTEKGEAAILAQEVELLAMNPLDIENKMPLFKACFEWINCARG